ncbi:MAG: glutathione S-transferase N-terminal domain-containing protein [Rhodospirillales bacterium]|nr:glutathione S-transferase N-terminal domain-containing protein [Rhodospirillales bacterium]MDE2199424.1 glutathione S-transferase N-terminal domain-containing protein [Rhodospirillales bacterium]MDE2574253.1 glutathione S-transferase N-terminal domain-containing protein [Rhodospirillales bacterium]
MKLYYSPASPFVRKVMACAITRGIAEQIKLLPTNPQLSEPAFVADNPLSKVPCLVTSDGTALFDSPVICEYLDSLDGGLPMFPRSGWARWRALKQQAISDGILDAAVGRRGELAKPKEAGRDAWMARQVAAIQRALDALEADLPHQSVDIGTISIACALGYLDFRYPGEPWRETRPGLAAWFATFATTPGIAGTMPTNPT